MTTLQGRTGSLAYADTGGDGPAVVFLHSIGLSGAMWQAQVDLLSPHRRVITVDFPGHGRSTASPPPYAIDNLGQDILQVIRYLGISRFEVVGVSLGGLMGLWLATEAPHSVERLVASNTAARVGSPEMWNSRIATVEEAGMAGIRDGVMERFFGENPPSDLVDRASEVFLATDPVGYIGCCTLLRDADPTRLVGGIVCPTLVVTGDRDIATPPEVTEELHRQIPGSKFVVIPGAAHLPNLDSPGQFNSALGDFLGV